MGCKTDFLYCILQFVQNIQILSYCRIIGGAADAAAMGAMLSILMKLFPGQTGKIIAWTGTASGLGHMAGEL